MVADHRSVHIGSGNMFSMLLHVLGRSLKVCLGPSVCQAISQKYLQGTSQSQLLDFRALPVVPPGSPLQLTTQ